MFSRIASHFPGETNPLYRLRDELKSRGASFRDLISGNVTECGINFPQTLLEDVLVRASRTCQTYRPDSFGQSSARQAVSEYYRRQGISLPSTQIVLTPGTSISYWYCFKLLADEGDEILCPRPSYPLFDYIAALSGVKLISYPLDEDAGWSIDCERLEASISTRTRAVALISPHNPTGHVASEDEIRQLAELAKRHDLAIISDEVFSEFLLRAGTLPRPAGTCAPLVCTLNGFSKMFALPGMKLGWIGVSGGRETVRQAMRALELISDTFLPVNDIVQAAVPRILEEGRPFLAWYAGQVRERWAQVEKLLKVRRCFDFVAPDGGFYLTLRLREIDEEYAARELLAKEHILLHPGYFYDMRPQHLILSFVQKQEDIAEVFPRFVSCLESLQR